MPMDATLQVRMDGQIKNNVEELYRNLGTSFAEAVRIFAQQSLLAGVGCPSVPPSNLGRNLLKQKLTVSSQPVRRIF